MQEIAKGWEEVKERKEGCLFLLDSVCVSLPFGYAPLFRDNQGQKGEEYCIPMVTTLFHTFIQ